MTTDGQGTWVAVWDSDDSLGGTIGTDSDILVAVRGPRCGDANDDALVNDFDVNSVRGFLADPAGSPLSPAGQAQCSVIGGPTDCDILDVVVLRRFLTVPPLPPGIAPVCEAVLGP